MTIGIDLEATRIKGGIVDGGLIYSKISEVFPFDEPLDKTIIFLIQFIRRLMNTNVRSIGIGVPSVVDTRRGIVYNAINMPSWQEVHLKEILEKEFFVPVNINNDCNCFAFGERYYGEATAFRNIVGIKIGTGLGAGIVINDLLYHGWNTGAGEVGSLPYRDSDYENYCAGIFFKRYNTTGYEAFIRAKYQDESAIAIWNEFGEHIGNLLKTILFAYDPQAIVIGGGFINAYPYFEKTMHESLSTFPYPETLKRIAILTSKKEDIELLGAATLIPMT